MVSTGSGGRHQPEPGLSEGLELVLEVGGLLRDVPVAVYDISTIALRQFDKGAVEIPSIFGQWGENREIAKPEDKGGVLRQGASLDFGNHVQLEDVAPERVETALLRQRGDQGDACGFRHNRSRHTGGTENRADYGDDILIPGQRLHSRHRPQQTASIPLWN